MSKCALVVVDVQNDFVSGSLALKECPAKQDGQAVVAAINHMRQACEWDLLVLTMDWHPADHCSFAANVGHQALSSLSPVKAADAKPFDTVVFADGTEQVLWPNHCVQQSWGAELVEGLQVAESDVVIKKGQDSAVDSYSAFFDNARKSKTGLGDRLQAAAVTDVFVCGLAFDVCVKFTALDSLALGFNTFVVEDACRGVEQKNIEITYRELRDKGCEIVHSSNIPRLLQRLRAI
eukprot:m.485064 g.485064  ORF g.485064 m.485064 type:complete len:235 (-) comp23648_c0_seq1:178-882(-)